MFVLGYILICKLFVSLKILAQNKQTKIQRQRKIESYSIPRPLKTSSSWKTIWWLAKYKHIFPWKWKNSIEDFLFWLRFQFDAAAAAPAQACRSWCCRGCHASPPNFGRLVTQYTLSYLLREQDVISEQEGKFSQNS